MTTRIRPLGPLDAAAYRDIRLEALTLHPEAFASAPEPFAALSLEDIRARLTQMDFFGAFAADGRLVGIMAFDQGKGERQSHRGYLYQVYVRAEARGTGLARALLDAVLDHAGRLVSQIHLGVAAHNQPAIRLYEKAGFRIYGTDPNYLYVNGRFIDEHLMVRFFDKAPGD